MPISTRASALRNVTRLARRNVIGVSGALIVLALALVAVFASQLSPYDPNDQIGKRLTAPNAQYPLGTDQLGRDELSRILFGAQVSLGIGVTSVALALVIGGTIGLVGGYYGGWFDTLAMRVMDLMFTLPSFVLALALTGIEPVPTDAT